MPRAPRTRHEEERPLPEQVADAMLATDSETAWYLDRGCARVVWVKKGQSSDPEIPARDVEDDEERFVEVPALTEGEIHGWMEDFAEACGDPAVDAALDDREGANARFEAAVAALPGGRAAEWHRHRRAEALRAAAAWLAGA